MFTPFSFTFADSPLVFLFPHRYSDNKKTLDKENISNVSLEKRDKEGTFENQVHDSRTTRDNYSLQNRTQRKGLMKKTSEDDRNLFESRRILCITGRREYHSLSS
jgi:hypothetical protein